MTWGDQWRALWKADPTREIFEERQRLLVRVCLAGACAALSLMILSFFTHQGPVRNLLVSQVAGGFSVLGFGTSAGLARRGLLNQAAFVGGVFLCVSVCAGEIVLQTYSDRLWYTLGGMILVGFALRPKLIWLALVCIFACIWTVPLFMPGYALGAGQYPTIVIDVSIFLFVVTMLLAGNARVTADAQVRALERLDALEHANQTAEQSRAAAEVASNTKSMFLANMTHELRTPLTSIIGYTELIVEETEDEPFFRDELGHIEHAAHHLLELINDVLDISKIESGRLHLHLEPVDVSALCHELEAILRPMCASRGNTLHLELAPQLPAFSTDRVRLRQVLLNLLSNANKFTHGGRIELGVSTLEDGQMCWVVRDEGVGIEADALRQIFETFVQASSNHEGTGLGLAISRQLCALMGGSLVAESQVGVGSTFTVTLPVLFDGVDGVGVG